jgi:hypothetical protein
MFPAGHSRNTTANLRDILLHKNYLFGRLALSESDLKEKLSMLNSIETLTNKNLRNIYECKLNFTKYSIDDEKYTE